MPSLDASLPAVPSVRRTGPGPAILWGGLIAGILDATYAMVLTLLRGGSVDRLWQFVASGLIGREAALGGGLPTAMLGITIHFFIALSAAAVYVTASRFLPILLKQPIPCGLFFGVCVYAVMNYVVIPLSRIRPGPFRLSNLIGGLLIHMLGIGLPIAFSARRSLGDRS